MTKARPQPFSPPRPLNGGNPWIFGFGGGSLEPAEWVVEPKLDGERILVHLPTGEVFNRKMAPYSKVHKIAGALAILSKRLEPYKYRLGSDGELLFEWIDAEALCCKGHELAGGSISVIDVDADGTLDERRELFSHLRSFPLTGSGRENAVYKMPRFPLNKSRWLWKKTIGLDPLFEGVVIKRRSSLYDKSFYSTTKETTDWQKYRA